MKALPVSTSFSTSSGLSPPHPLLALLSEDRQKEFASLTAEEQNAFYGRVIASVLSSEEYQKLAFETAAREFDQISAARTKN